MIALATLRAHWCAAAPRTHRAGLGERAARRRARCWFTGSWCAAATPCPLDGQNPNAAEAAAATAAAEQQEKSKSKRRRGSTSSSRNNRRRRRRRHLFK
jgi:hypothetical protein